jgi:hypothetical protein
MWLIKNVKFAINCLHYMGQGKCTGHVPRKATPKESLPFATKDVIYHYYKPHIHSKEHFLRRHGLGLGICKGFSAMCLFIGCLGVVIGVLSAKKGYELQALGVNKKLKCPNSTND